MKSRMHGALVVFLGGLAAYLLVPPEHAAHASTPAGEFLSSMGRDLTLAGLAVIVLSSVVTQIKASRCRRKV